MIKKYLTYPVIFMLFFVLYSGVFSDIIEVKYFKEIASHIDQETLVVFDLDNTLIQTSQTLGSDQWFSKEIERNIEKGMEFNDALEMALEIYVPVQNKTSVTLVEEGITEFIDDLKDQGNSIIALTARNHNLQEATIRQLQSVGITFNTDEFNQTSLDLKGDGTVNTLKGIVFLDGQNKGTYLLSFLDTMNWNPKKIVFVDDKLKNVKDVEEALNKRGVDCTGIRYGHLDEKVESINMTVADVQLQFFNQLLSDEIVESLLEES